MTTKPQPQRYRMNSLRNILSGKTAANGNYPPTLKMTPKSEAYKGYATAYVEIAVRTNIDSDAGNNNGLITAEFPANDLEAALIWARDRSLVLDDKQPSMELTAYKTVWTKSGGRSEKPLPIATLRISRKGGIWRMGLVKEGRPNCAFEFGAGPENRKGYSTAGGETDSLAEYSGACLRRWANSILDYYADDIEVSIVEALKKDVEKNGEHTPGSYQGRQQSHTTTESRVNDGHDDDIPF